MNLKKKTFYRVQRVFLEGGEEGKVTNQDVSGPAKKVGKDTFRAPPEASRPLFKIFYSFGRIKY